MFAAMTVLINQRGVCEESGKGLWVSDFWKPRQGVQIRARDISWILMQKGSLGE